MTTSVGSGGGGGRKRGSSGSGGGKSVGAELKEWRFAGWGVGGGGYFGDYGAIGWMLCLTWW